MISRIVELVQTHVDRFKEYNRKVNWALFCLIFTFSAGSWIDLNGMWCELPVMVRELPEGWKLPAIITIFIEIANLSPLFFIVGKWLAPKKFNFVMANYVILSIGVVSMVFMIFFWNHTAYIAGANRSLGLLVLVFLLAILDATSSVTFMPYIGLYFSKEYFVPYYIGESLSSFVPGVLSIIQGLSQEPGCQNVTSGNSTSLVRLPIQPNFSVSVFFLLLALLLCLCIVAFSFIHFSPLAIRHRKTAAIEDNEDHPYKNSTLQIIDNPDQKERLSLNFTTEEYILFLIVFAVTFFAYGILVSIQSYSTLPYGNAAFTYSINLTFIITPFFVLFSIASYNVSVLRICVEFAIAMAFTLYLIIIACLSPCPPFMGNFLGPFLSVLSWVIAQPLFMRVRCLAAARLERLGQRPLLIIGAMTQLGQVFGGVLGYVLVDVLELFRQTPECVSDYREYCH